MWNIAKAQGYMFKLGMDHIEDGLYAEGGELIYESQWGDGCDSKQDFRLTISRICEWDKEDIDQFIKEMKL